jgi:regulator of protease activity HflC (stomatin/prohibitin superfamily)
MRWILIASATTLAGCATVEPGHIGLYANWGGLKHELLMPGHYVTGFTGSVKDFDITYSTRNEEIRTTSSEGLPLDLHLSVIYRPVQSELYELLTQVGPEEAYYREVVGPEFRSAARGVFARHSYNELLKKNEQIEDEVEADLRRRIAGKHVEINSVTLEAIQYEPAIAKVKEEEQKVKEEMQLAEQSSALQKTRDEAAFEQKQREDKAAFEQKQRETELAKAQRELERVREESEAQKRLIAAKSDAENRLISAKAEAEEAKLVAHAKAEQAKAYNATLTPLSVMAKGYEALKELGGTNTHILIGDWSKIPNFLFPPMTGGKATATHDGAAPTQDNPN